MIIKLYTTLGCHLCEQALEMLLAQDPGFPIEEIEISTDAKLMETYGVRIPVIATDTTEAELDWPFDVAQLIRFLSAG